MSATTITHLSARRTPRGRRARARISLLLALTALLWIPSGGAVAQRPTDAEQGFKRETYFRVPEPERADPGPTTETKDEAWTANIDDDLLPGPLSRFWRSTGFEFSWVDQRNCIVQSMLGSAGELVCARNPKSDLRRVGFTLRPGRWFRSATDFSAAYAVAGGKATRGLVDAKTDPLATDGIEDKDKLDYLAWTGRGGPGKRFLAAFRITLSDSERSRVQGRDPLPRPPDDESALTGTVRFDPDALVTFPGDLAAAYAALDAHTSLRRENRSGLEERPQCTEEDTSDPVDCLRRLTPHKLHGRWLAGLLPTIEFTRLDEFDFVYGVGNTNVFLTSPLLEESLDTIKVTWDLGSALNGASHRRNAVQAIALHHKLVKRDKMRQLTLTARPPADIAVAAGQLVHVPIYAEYSKTGKDSKTEQVTSATWSLSVGPKEAKEPKDLRPLKELNLSLTAEGILVGRPPKSQAKDLLLTVSDEYLNTWPRASACEGTDPRFRAIGKDGQKKCFGRIVLSVS